MSTRLLESRESEHVCVIRTILFSDVVGSTLLVASLGDRRSSELWAQHDRIARDLLLRFAGKEIDKSDGFFMLFERPIDAVGYALAFHDKLADLSDDFGAAIGVRVGIHMGEVFLRVATDEDVARGAKCLEVTGLAVPTTARVMSLAGKGQTLLTGATFDLARRAAVGDATVSDDVSWMSHGFYEVNGLDGAIRVCEVGCVPVAPLAPPLDSAKSRRCVDSSATPMDVWLPGPQQVVPGSGGWKLQRRQGRGGFGETWIARHPKWRAARIFKFWFGEDSRRAPQQEMEMCQLLGQKLGTRSDIIHVYCHRIDHPPYFLVLEYLPQGNLVDWAERQGGIAQVSLEVRLELVAQVAVALQAAHSIGVIHNDIKPSNVLIRQDGDEMPRACLTDFGIGELAVLQLLRTEQDKSAAGTSTVTSAGTRLYLSPEQMVSGTAMGHQSDIYALGVMLFQMIVGDLYRPLVHGWVKSIDDELLRGAVEDCVSELPADRLERADMLAERLRSIDARRRAMEAGLRRRRVWKQVYRLMRVLIVTSVLVALVAAGVELGYQREQDARSQAQAILAQFGSDPNTALQDSMNVPDMVRRFYGEAVVHQLFSSVAVERVAAARAALWGDESVEAAFWASSNGGPVWEHADWREVCTANFMNPAPLIPKLEARAKRGTDREKYVACCLLGDLAKPADRLAELCVRTAETESHQGVIAAAFWAAARLGRSIPLRARDERSGVEPSGMAFVPIAGLRALNQSDSRPAHTYSRSRVHHATVDDDREFHISATIVTWGQIEPFLLTGGRRNPGLDALLDGLKQGLEGFDGERQAYAPANGVSPILARAFCEWLTLRARQAGLTDTYRLPTLAEWRFVYQDGGRYTRHCDRDSKSLKRSHDDPANAYREHFRVAAIMPNFFGVFHTDGDIEELCAIPGTEALARPLEQGIASEPDASSVSSAGNNIGICRPLNRANSTSSPLSPRLGFRVVREP